MTEKLSDIEARIGTVDQLSTVITAMRAIAAARSREARARVDGIRTYSALIAGAIGQALAFLAEQRRSDGAPGTAGTHAIVALCAEQGFAGVFSERVLDAVRRVSQESKRQYTHMELLLIGDRGLMLAEQQDIAVSWSAPMIARAEQMATLANQIVEVLYERVGTGRVTRVTVLHAVPDSSAALQIVEKRLLPFDFDRFPPSPAAVAPLLTLPPNILFDRLVEEYVFAAICEAVMLSFAAENEARMRAMITARTNVANMLDELITRSRQLRQEAITDEIIELAAGSAAHRTSRKASARRGVD